MDMLQVNSSGSDKIEYGGQYFNVIRNVKMRKSLNYLRVFVDFYYCHFIIMTIRFPFCVNEIGKGMNPTILPPAKGK